MNRVAFGMGEQLIFGTSASSFAQDSAPPSIMNVNSEPFSSINSFRRIEDASAGDYVFPSPFLTCSWSQTSGDNSLGQIFQNCDYIVPNATDNEAGDPFSGYWVQSQCIWSDIYQNSIIDCNVTDSYSLYMPTRPKYNVRCSTEKLANGLSVKDACQTGNAWLPDQTCLRECFTRQNRNLEEGDMEISEFCDACYYSSGETCNFSFHGQETETIDYHGLAWSDTLLETMKENLSDMDDDGGMQTTVNLYDVPLYQPSLIRNDFAYEMTFICPSGVYRGGSMKKIRGTMTKLYGLIAVLVVILIFWLACRKHDLDVEGFSWVAEDNTALDEYQIV